MNWLNNTKIEKTVEWLNAKRAASLISLAKLHGAKTKRLAQSRKDLGVIKVIITFDSHSWAASNDKMAAFRPVFEAWVKETGYIKP